MVGNSQITNIQYNVAALPIMALLSVDQARERILSNFQPVTTETLPLTGCSNRVLAQDIVAANDLPPFDNSSMDGFAVRAADVLAATSAAPRRLRVVADIKLVVEIRDLAQLSRVLTRIESLPNVLEAQRTKPG